MDWRVAYIRALGGKPTKQALDFLAKWQPFEGGHTNNDARYNYLNTTQSMPGSKPINSVGVKSYASLAQGAQAFARTLKGNPNYAGLLGFLTTGQGDPTPGLSTWVSGQPDSAHGRTYASKVLGGMPVSTGGETPALDSLDTGGPQMPMGVQNGAAQIRSQALAGLSAIATGRQKPTEAFGDIGALMKTLSQSIPKIDIPSAPVAATPQGYAPVESKAAQLAKKYLGVKYTWGGTTAKGGFDCSGLLQTVWKQLGVDIPRVTYDQWKSGKPVDVSQLKPGDAVFFHPGSRGPEHVGMYVGEGKFIEAPRTGLNVRISSLAGRSDYMGARRFV